MRVGVVGLGAIWPQYSSFFGRAGVDVAAVADLDTNRVEAARVDWPSATSCDITEMFEMELDAIVNLTTPRHHGPLAAATVYAGTSVYNEKPLALDVATAAELLAGAATSGALVGCAPDTVLGTGVQTARHVIDHGGIGRPIAALATMLVPGHEAWHPNPDFYYEPGGGPLYDMGPYYITALVHLLGPVREVMAVGSRTRPTRTIGSGPRSGDSIPVEVDTHVAGVLVHDTGAVSTLTMSFDVVATTSAPIEVHGESASLLVPDPNRFDGTVRLRGAGDDAWRDVAVTAGYVGVGRGIGVIDMLSGGHRANAEMALHVLDVIESLTRSSTERAAIEPSTTVARPTLVPLTRAPSSPTD